MMPNFFMFIDNNFPSGYFVSLIRTSSNHALNSNWCHSFFMCQSLYVVFIPFINTIIHSYPPIGTDFAA